MNVLFLGPEDSPLIEWLRKQGEHVEQTSERIDAETIDRLRPDFVVSYGYRHILRNDVLSKMPGRAINLHISCLPWNRGADPNFWSFVEGTPKGVTIHYLDEGVDTGDIIAQQEVELDEETDTLATSYAKLQAAIQELFKQHWQAIKSGTCQRIPQQGKGSSHRVKDKESLSQLFTDGWNTPVSVLKDFYDQQNE